MLELRNVSVTYGKNPAPTVEGISLRMEQGQIISLVGESGSGKSTVIRAILGCLPGDGRVSRGEILFEEQPLSALSREEWRNLRGTEISMIFQDAGAMLNPIRKIGTQYTEYIRTHERIPKKEAWARGVEMLERMRLPNGERIMNSYPFQLSGGMRQRVGIAMAMTFQPKLLLGDEPTSALDVTTQAQIVRQMLDLRNRYNTGIILVTHNLGVAAYMSDLILVMRNGRVVESGDREQILRSPLTDYTKSLLEAVPTLGGERFV